ncbi:MAG: divalent-cation tolerance protein CutA [Candidatus Omnitrophica bacterium]|nr:divalent-cation tolerance protein CutA [Candidatus Omnitrophota bacterium]
MVLLITVSDKKQAHRIAKALIKNKLVACVNILGGVESFFWWNKKIDSAKEILLIAKSRNEKLNKIIKLVKAMHSYDCPEIIALPITGGSKTYLDWIDESLR